MSAPTPLARAMVRLARDPSLRQRLGANAQETARRLTWMHCAEETVQAYDEGCQRLR